jgi:hypothetical protein
MNQSSTRFRNVDSGDIAGIFRSRGFPIAITDLRALREFINVHPQVRSACSTTYKTLRDELRIHCITAMYKVYLPLLVIIVFQTKRSEEPARMESATNGCNFP